MHEEKKLTAFLISITFTISAMATSVLNEEWKYKWVIQNSHFILLYLAFFLIPSHHLPIPMLLLHIIFIGYSDLHTEYNAMTIDVSTGSWKSVLLSSPFCLTFNLITHMPFHHNCSFTHLYIQCSYVFSLTQCWLQFKVFPGWYSLSPIILLTLFPFHHI